MITEGADDRASAPGRIALGSPLEAFLWIFITRLIALVTAGRAASLNAAPDDSPTTGPSGARDPDRARRVAASRPAIATRSPASDLIAGSTRHTRSDPTARAVAVTAAASFVAGTAAFAAGRRRGRR